MKNKIVVVLLCGIVLLSGCTAKSDTINGDNSNLETADEEAAPLEVTDATQNKATIDKEYDRDKGALYDVLEVQSLGDEIEFNSLDEKIIVIKKQDLDKFITNHTLEIGDRVIAHFNEYTLNDDGRYSIDLVYAYYFEKDSNKLREW